MATSQDNSGIGCKQLKVDNWGSFFLHRLQMLYEKGEKCDITLQFHDGGEIRVHRLVLVTCTDYFQNLTMTPDNTLVLPPVLKHSTVLPIIDFMYTGRLDFRFENHQSLLNTAKLLNMTILVKLLNAQVKHDGSSAGSVGSQPTPVSKNFLKKIVSSPSTTTSSTTLPGKKLPFWKKRTTPSHLPDEFYQSDAMQSSSRQIKTETAKPTRFEWPEESDVKSSPIMLYSPSFDNISYDSELMVKPLALKRPSSDQQEGDNQSQDSQDGQSESSLSFAEKLKRLKPNTDSESCFNLPSDDDDDDDDYDDGHFESVHNHDDDDDYDEDEEDANCQDVRVVRSESSESHGLNKTNDSVQSNEVPSNSAVSTANPLVTVSTTTVTTPKPILKPLTSDLTPSTNQSKKVRFSLSSEGKENTNKKSDKQLLTQNNLPNVGGITAKVMTTPTPGTNKSDATNPTNHAKIICEVIKKYPELVKNNKNIRLKIMTPNNKIGLPKATLPATTSSLNKNAISAKSKVSYVVMKSDLSNQNNQQEDNLIVSTPSSGAENTTGPWFCHTCGSNNEPLNFDTYYLYRRHLQDVHMERIDARICEHCGYKSSKRNLHLYHLYTKHNIQPPRNINFPKCDQCEYIALSDSLLIKHRNNHVGIGKDYVCKVCNAGFRSHGALQGHMQTSLHSDNPNKEYQCDYCDKVFNRNINLKAHIRTAHKDESRKLYDEEDPTPQQNLLQVIQVPVIDNLQNNLKGQQTVLLPPGMTILAESPAVPLLPSSESEALSNVASGIATSLNLNESNIISDQTVIFLDSNSELLFDQSGNPVVMAETVITDGTSGEVQEYIIPEMIANASSISQVFTTRSQPVVTTAAEVVPIALCNRHQQQQQCNNMISPDVPSSDHTYADESSQQNEDIENNSVQEAREIEGNISMEAAENSCLQEEELQQDNHTVQQQEETISIVTNDDQLLSRSVETIQFAASNADKNVTNNTSPQPMEVCERDSIIIQPSVIQQSNFNVTSQSSTIKGVQSVVQAVSSGGDNVECLNSSTVIVNTAAPSLLLSSSKKQPKDELVQDWDDFDDENTASCPLEEIDTRDAQADDIKPSRPTIELEESILPDM